MKQAHRWMVLAGLAVLIAASQPVASGPTLVGPPPPTGGGTIVPAPWSCPSSWVESSMCVPTNSPPAS